jgi:hypothetical protein
MKLGPLRWRRVSLVEPTGNRLRRTPPPLVPDFFAQANEMRRIFDERMGRERSRGAGSFVWGYGAVRRPESPGV